MKKVLLLVSLIVASANMYALNENGGKNKVIDLGEKNIYSETGFETSLRSSISSPIIIDSKTIERKKYKNFLDILNDVSEITISNGSFGKEINIRGQEDSRENIQLLIDGIELNLLEKSHATIPFEVININEIERIEIIPGGGAVLYGSGTVGGVINIITKSYNKTHANAGFRYGSYNQKISDVGLGLSLDSMNLSLNYRNIKGDGYRKEHDKREMNYFSGKLKYDFNKNNSLILSYDKMKNSEETPDELSKTDLDKDRRMTKDYSKHETKKEGLSLNYISKFNSRNTLNLLAYQQKLNIDMKSMGMELDDIKKGIKIKNKYNYADGSNLVVGLGYSKGDIERRSFMYSEANKKTFDIFASNTYRYNKFEFTQGLRYEKSTYDIVKDFEMSMGPRKIKNYVNTNKKAHNFAGNLAVNYLYSDTGNIYTKFERGFTSPSPLKLIDNRNGVYTLNNLKSEKSNTFEIGWNDFIFNSLISADVYYNIIKDDIEMSAHSMRDMRFFNIGKTRRYGFNIKAEQKFDKFTFNESYSYVNAKIRKDTNKDSEGKYISGVSPHKFILGVDYAVNKKLNIGLDGQYTSDYYLDNTNKYGKDGKKIVFNLRADYKVLEDLNIYAGINNLLNNKYNENVSLGRTGKFYSPAPTRNYYAGFSWKF